MKKGWKVIRKEDRKSCTARSRKVAVTYIKNKEVKRPEKEGPLAVFETREAAREFMRIYTHGGIQMKSFCKIVKCLYEEASELFLWEQSINVHNFDSYALQLADRNEKHILPPRTALADSVTCLE